VQVSHQRIRGSATLGDATSSALVATNSRSRSHLPPRPPLDRLAARRPAGGYPFSWSQACRITSGSHYGLNPLTHWVAPSGPHDRAPMRRSVLHDLHSSNHLVAVGVVAGRTVVLVIAGRP
jgi:hypothetical protein